MWPNAKNCILPIIRRKDMSNEIIDAAIEIIISECAKFEAITDELFDGFSIWLALFRDASSQDRVTEYKIVAYRYFLCMI
jgi:hypothetical protein